ncbi:MAG TPA: cyclic nucleotide-binding domain-containing protein [Thermoanaerobaculia bacterium]|nr:cyclic nucleotide-binding domain-containing protein [Thermoanaerobaculia bacterium]
MKAVFKTTGGGKDPTRDVSVNYAEGDTIFREGELGTEMFIIHDGEVNIVKRFGSETIVLSRLSKGDFFGEMSVIDNAPRSADAVAASNVTLLAINGARFDEMIRKTPEIAVRIIRKYSKRLREANAMLERAVGEETNARRSPHATEAQIDPAHRMRLVDMATGIAFFFSRADETTIGRADPVTGILPDIDLTAVDTNRSVSRRHAKIIRREGELFALEEVGTVNGTFVNDQRIATGQPFPVHNGDRLKIGLIQMKVVLD